MSIALQRTSYSWRDDFTVELWVGDEMIGEVNESPQGSFVVALPKPSKAGKTIDVALDELLQALQEAAASVKQANDARTREDAED